MPKGTVLRTVPGQVSSGAGWHYDAVDKQVDITGNNAVVSGLYMHCNLNVTGSSVTIKDDRVVVGGAYGISLRHTTGDTVENSTVSGLNTSTGRVDSAIADLYGDSTGMVIENNNIAAFRTAVQLTSGLVTGNYIHDPGYLPGDHTNGVLANGGTQQLMIYHNTILNNLGQTDAITIDTASGRQVANKTIENNLLAGGAYPIYGGDAFRATTRSIVIEDNRFGQGYYSKSGQYGPAAYFDAQGKGNTWSGNTWMTTGHTVPVP